MKRRMLLAISLAAGCRAAEPGVPTYPKMDAAEAAATIRARDAEWPRGSGRGELTLTRTDGKSISLDAVFVLDLPGRLRLRAFKFTQAVFDVTYADGRPFIYSPKDASLTTAATRASDDFLASLSRWPQLLHFVPPEGAAAKVSWDSIEFESPFEPLGALRSTFDRNTLLLRRQALVAPDGRVPLSVDQIGYSPALTGGVSWPSHFAVKSPGGTIELTTRQWQANVVRDNAFTPPPRAVEIR